MAIQWGNYESAQGFAMRVGCETIVQPVTNASTQVTVQVKMYTQNRENWPEVDGQTLNYGPDMSGSVNFTNNEGTGIILRDTRNYVQGYGSSYGVSPGTVALGAQLAGAFNGITPSKRNTVVLPPRPFAAPAAPSGLSATRNSDSQVTLNWTRNATTAANYTSQTIQERVWASFNGTWSWSSWSDVGTNSTTYSNSAAQSYVRTGLRNNRVYQYRVRANNSVGSSAYSPLSGLVYMTPSAPANVVSRMNAAGTQITTTWAIVAYPDPSNPGGSGVSTNTIQRSVNGGAWTNLATGLPRLTFSYTDTSPGATSNRYRVLAVQSAGPLSSTATEGNLVVPSPPLAPTNLRPNGVAVDFTRPVTFTWQHNPGTDNANQSAFTLEYSSNGGSSWSTLPGASAVSSTISSFTLPANTLTNGINYLWRARTWGVTAQGAGPVSAAATVIGYGTPVAAITNPSSPTTNITPITVTWTYSQAQASPQASYTVTLLNADGTQQLEQITGTGTTSEVTFAYLPVNQTTYQIRVVVTAANGLVSDTATLVTQFALIPPADASVVGQFVACEGSVNLTMNPGTVISGTNVPTDSATVERRADGGEWVLLAQHVLLPTTLLDTLPVTNGVNEYRVTSESGTGSTSALIYEVNGTDGQAQGDPLWAWVSWGDHFEHVLRVRGDLAISESAGRQRATQAFLGRSRPVALLGQNTSHSVAVSGSLYFDRRCPIVDTTNCTYDASPREWREAGLAAEVVCYRDFTGRRLFGVLSDVSLADDIWPGNASVSFAVTEVDFTERYVRLVTSTDTEA